MPAALLHEERVFMYRVWKSDSGREVYKRPWKKVRSLYIGGSNGDRYHEEHFQCSFCQKVLDVDGGDRGKGFKGYNGKPFCVGCHLKLYG